MNESVDLLPFSGGPIVGRKRRALAALCLLTRSGAALVLGATLILEPKTVLAEFGYNQGNASRDSDVLIEQLLGVRAYLKSDVSFCQIEVGGDCGGNHKRTVK